MAKKVKFRNGLLVVAALHAVLVSLSLGLTFLAVRLRETSLALNLLSDILVTALCAPLQPLLTASRLDLFFILLPLNTTAYAFLVWLPIYWFRRRQGR